MNTPRSHTLRVLPSHLGFSLALLCGTATAQWSSNPALNLDIAVQPGDQAVPKIAASGDGSTWMSWFDNRAGSYAVYVQRLDAQGNATFAPGGLLVSANPQSSSLVDWSMISDGGDGCVLAFTDTRAGGDLDVYAYRINANGNFVWGPNGVTLSNNADFESNPSCARTSDGHFVIAWSRSPSPGPGAVHVQRLDAAGNSTFSGDGLQIVGAGVDKPGFAAIVAADNGGWIVGYLRDTATFQSNRYLIAQKFDSAGNPLWNGGTPLPVYDQSSLSIGYQFQILPDEAGGVVFGWHRALGNDFQVVVQHVGSAGNEVFAHNGLVASLSAATIELDPALAYLPASGDIVVIFDKRNSGQSMWSLSAQRVSAAGTLLWTNDGVDLMPLDATVKSILRCVPFGDGAEAYCFWQPSMASQDMQVLGFRLDGAGASMWSPSPLPVSTAMSSKLRIAVCTDGSGVARMIWADNRNAGNGADMYAQNVNCDGTLGNTSPCGATSYCVAAPNSVGPGAQIGSSGSTCTALNDFTLTCNGLPPNTNGLWFYGANAGQIPFGNGFRCVTGSVFRLGPAQTVGAQGTTSRFVDLNVPPASGGASAITGGSTWRFQFWYRNPAGGGAGFNLSNGLEAVFCP